MSEKSENESEVSEEAQKWPLPFNVGMDSLDKIVKAFRLAGADKQEVSPDDLERTASLNTATIKSNMKFLTAIGILKVAENKTSYLFEKKGAAYAEALATENRKASSTLLKELMTDSYVKELIGYVELQKPSGLTFDGLFNHIKGMARLKEDSKYGATGIASPYKTGITALIDLLVRADIVPQDIVKAKEEGKMQTPIKKPQRKTEREPPTSIKITTSIKPFQGTEGNFPFTLNMTVEAKDPESIKQLISLIRELTGKYEQNDS